MKTRLGFVSNSSSSSFFVKMVDLHKPLLTKKQKEVLSRYGFKGEFISRYDILCNQDEVIAFLVRHKVPFFAECHYGHYDVVYRPEWNHVKQCWRPLAQFDTYEDPKSLTDRKIEEIPLEHFRE